MSEEGDDCRIFNRRLSRLLLGKPAALMKTSEQADCPTLLETRGLEENKRGRRVMMKQTDQAQIRQS